MCDCTGDGSDSGIIPKWPQNPLTDPMYWQWVDRGHEQLQSNAIYGAAQWLHKNEFHDCIEYAATSESRSTLCSIIHVNDRGRLSERTVGSHDLVEIGNKFERGKRNNNHDTENAPGTGSSIYNIYMQYEYPFPLTETLLSCGFKG